MLHMPGSIERAINAAAVPAVACVGDKYVF
jgi:hypothetical protein